MGCFVRGGKNGMGCFVRGDKNCMGCFVRGGKAMRDVLSGVSKNGMGCFVPGCFVLHSQIVCANPGMAVHIPLRMRCFWTMPRMPLKASDNWPMQQQLSMLHSPTNSHMFNLPHLIWPSPYSKWMVAYLLGLADFFPNHLVFKNSLRDTFRVSNSLNPDQARHNVVPDLGPNCS